MFLSFLSIDLGAQRYWPLATPDFGSVSAISALLLQDIPRHPDTRLFEVREAFKRSSLLGFQVYIGAYIAMVYPVVAPGALTGGTAGGLLACAAQTRAAGVLRCVQHETQST